MLSKSRADRRDSPIVDLSAVFVSFSLEKERSADAVVTGSVCTGMQHLDTQLGDSSDIDVILLRLMHKYETQRGVERPETIQH